MHLSESGYMLWQMATVTGDRYEPDYLKKCSKALEFFEADGQNVRTSLETSDSHIR